jgi:hypothetical protein
MADFPAHPDQIELRWLSERLHEAGALEGEVRALRWEPIGTGQVGDSVRIHIEYDRDGAGPATLAGKFPAADATSRGTAAAFGLYAKEVGFYRELQPHLAVRVPRTYAAEIAENATDFILLFEDLGPARQGNQLASCTAHEARAGIRQAAALHAPSWGNPAIIEKPWLQARLEVTAQIAALYPRAQEIFRERYADSLEPEFMQLCEDLAELNAARFDREQTSQCLIHGDFRLDNMLFAIKGGAEPIAVLDWQTVALGNGLTDIGYFLGTGIGDALRRKHEAELLDLYCAEMTARGVALSRDAIWDDYVIGALHGVSTAVFSSAYVERTERGDANFLSMARGGCALALQHGSLSKLKG